MNPSNKSKPSISQQSTTRRTIKHGRKCLKIRVNRESKQAESKQSKLSRRSRLEKYVEDLEFRVTAQCGLIPKAELHWFGSVDQVCAFMSNPVLKPQNLVGLLEQIKKHQQVIVLDFGWSNFVTFMTQDGWGYIPNLHPSGSWRQQEQHLQRLLQSVQGLKTLTSPGSRGSKRLTALQDMVKAQLLSGDQFREQIRVAMFDLLKTICDQYNTIITESLDVARLYEHACKRKAIDDLDWWHLLKRLNGISNPHQRVVLVERDFKSLTCPICFYSSVDNRQKNCFKCQRCRVEIHPDLVALLNFWRSWLETPEHKQVGQ